MSIIIIIYIYGILNHTSFLACIQACKSKTTGFLNLFSEQHDKNVISTKGCWSFLETPECEQRGWAGSCQKTSCLARHLRFPHVWSPFSSCSVTRHFFSLLPSKDKSLGI